MKTKALLAALLALGTSSLFGYVLEGQSWTPNRTVVMQLSLGAPRQLMDGSPSFNQTAKDALEIWNEHLAHLQFASVLASPVAPSQDDDELSCFFSATVFGEDFGDGVLAITLLSYRTDTFEQSDTIFNSALAWDSYRGSLRADVVDFRRVALHEFGHTLGLDHPDAQMIASVMTSHISGIDDLQPDDIAGVDALYGKGPNYLASIDGPVLKNISTRALVGTGDGVLIGGFIVQGSQPATIILRGIGPSLAEGGLAGELTDPMVTVYDSTQRQIASNDDWFTGKDAATIASFNLDPHNSRESALYLTLQPGAYTAVLQSYSDANTPPSSGVGLIELYDLGTNGGRAGNISTRSQVLGGDNVLIGGLIVGGEENKTVVVRAIGPSLSGAGIANPLADPILELHNSSGAIVKTNDNWQQGPNFKAIDDAGLAPTNAKESALEATLAPGAYTAVVRGVNGGVGTAVVEVYDLSPAPGD